MQFQIGLEDRDTFMEWRSSLNNYMGYDYISYDYRVITKDFSGICVCEREGFERGRKQLPEGTKF